MKTNKIRKAFETIKIDDEKKLDNRILNNTINKKEKNTLFNIYKLKWLIIICLIITFIITSTFVVKAIVKSYTLNRTQNGDNIKTSVEVSGKLKINSNANISCSDKIRIKDVENELNINFILNLEKFKKEFNECEIVKNKKDKIRRVYLGNDDFYDFELENKKIEKETSLSWMRKKITLEVYFMTNYAEEDDINYFKNIISYEGEEDDMVFEYHSDRLDTTVQIIKFIDTEYYSQTYGFFVYNNISYLFRGYNVDKQEMIDLIESLK